MRSAQIALVLALVAIAGPAVRAEELDKRTCQTLKVELAGMLAVGVKDDMEQGAQWALANLPPEKLAKIRRLIEIEEQLEFRCGLSRQRVVAVAPAEGPGKKDKPEEPERKPGKPATSEQSGIATNAKLPPKAEKTEKKVAAPANPPSAPKTQAAAAKKPDRREASTYISPQEVNPFSLSRYGTTR